MIDKYLYVLINL